MAFTRGKCLLPSLLKIVGLSQSELARRVGYSPRMISHYCTDTKPMSPEAMYNIALVIRRYIKDFRMEDLYEWQ